MVHLVAFVWLSAAPEQARRQRAAKVTDPLGQKLVKTLYTLLAGWWLALLYGFFGVMLFPITCAIFQWIVTGSVVHFFCTFGPVLPPA